MSQRIDGGQISHKVYFHSKARPSSGLKELSVLLAFLRKPDGDQRENGTHTNTPERMTSNAKLYDSYF